jgi:MraZ protein
MFRGINDLQLDDKGRVALPMRYRPILLAQEAAACVVTIDTNEPCLLLYPVKQWQLIEDNLLKLPSFNEASRRIQRLLIGHATDVVMDGQGRILLPQLLRDYAKLAKQESVLLVGQGNRFELWCKSVWNDKRDVWLAAEASTAELPESMKDFYL